MNKLLMAVFLIVTTLLFFNYNETVEFRKVLGEAVLPAEQDVTATETIAEGNEYEVLPIEITVRKGNEFALQNLRRCGKYFYTIKKNNKTYIGFRFPLSATTKVATWVQRDFPKDTYRVIHDDYDNSSPTVEFNDGEIIVRINKMDLREAPCFWEHTII